MSAKLVNDLAGDALATIERIRGDARHLKELGQRAKVMGQIAARQAKQKIETALETVADRLVDLEDVFHGVKIPSVGMPQRGRE